MLLYEVSAAVDGVSDEEAEDPEENILLGAAAFLVSPAHRRPALRRLRAP